MRKGGRARTGSLDWAHRHGRVRLADGSREGIAIPDEHISTTLGYAKEVQNRGGRFGEPFPPIPRELAVITREVAREVAFKSCLPDQIS